MSVEIDLSRNGRLTKQQAAELQISQVSFRLSNLTTSKKIPKTNLKTNLKKTL